MLSFFPRGVLDEILNLIESVSEGFPSYSLRVGIFLYESGCICLDSLVLRVRYRDAGIATRSYVTLYTITKDGYLCVFGPGDTSLCPSA